MIDKQNNPSNYLSEILFFLLLLLLTVRYFTSVQYESIQFYIINFLSFDFYFTSDMSVKNNFALVISAGCQ